MKNWYISFDHFKRKMCKWRKDCALDVHGVLLSMLKDQFSSYNFDFCCSELSSDDGGITHLWNVGRQSFYMAV
jgi:hypothetical protein